MSAQDELSSYRYGQYSESLSSLLRHYDDWRSSAADHLRLLVEGSERKLHPFSDPLRRDSWSEDLLSRRSEPHFSRWLKWLLQQLQEPAIILSLFGDDDPEFVDSCQNIRPEVVAEEFSLFGHSNQTGRLDLVVRYPRTALIAVEIKLDCAERADLPKQEGYRQWLDAQGLPAHRIKRYLLALDGTKEEFEGGFRLRRWRDLTVALRRALIENGHSQGFTERGIAFYFLSCVEQDLLNLISLEEAERGIITDPRRIRLTAEYLQKSISE